MVLVTLKAILRYRWAGILTDVGPKNEIDCCFYNNIMVIDSEKM